MFLISSMYCAWNQNLLLQDGLQQNDAACPSTCWRCQISNMHPAQTRQKIVEGESVVRPPSVMSPVGRRAKGDAGCTYSSAAADNKHHRCALGYNPARPSSDYFIAFSTYRLLHFFHHFASDDNYSEGAGTVRQ